MSRERCQFCIHEARACEKVVETERALADQLAEALRSLERESALEGPDDERLRYQTYQITRGEMDSVRAAIAAHAQARREG